ncbi:MAG: YqaE/Pmp3 family membrane protein [Myxococcota bacterium]
MDVIRVLLSILIPPLGVFLKVGLGLHFWLSLVLTFMGYLPGLVHAVWVIVSSDNERRLLTS